MTRVALEVGKTKVFASALDWPGWARSGKDEGSALDALRAFASRYALVARAAGVDFAANQLRVVERLPGSATTEFGAPGEIAASDRDLPDAAETKRIAALVEAAWRELERIAAISPQELRKGPRGGGRDRDKMLDHVLGAESAYGRQIGVKHPQPAFDDQAAIATLRKDIVAALLNLRAGVKWPPRYAARRIAWHVLDHAWEMEDRRI